MHKTLLKIEKSFVQKTFITCNPSCSKLCVLCSNFYFARSFVLRLRTMILFWQSFVLQIGSPNGAFLSICTPLCTMVFFRAIVRAQNCAQNRAILRAKNCALLRAPNCAQNRAILRAKNCAILRAPNCAQNRAILRAKNCALLRAPNCAQNRAILRAKNCAILRAPNCAQNRAILRAPNCAILCGKYCHPSCAKSSIAVFKNFFNQLGLDQNFSDFFP